MRPRSGSCSCMACGVKAAAAAAITIMIAMKTLEAIPQQHLYESQFIPSVAHRDSLRLRQLYPNGEGIRPNRSFCSVVS